MSEHTHVYEALSWASSFLKDRGKETQAARWLLEETIGLEGVQFQLAMRNELSSENRKRYEQMIKRFATGEPVQYITGHAHFYGRTFKVNPDVLIPRPETEELVELVLKQASSRFKAPKIVDIATGSGVIALTIASEWQAAHVTATDISPGALAVTEKNKQHLQCQHVDVLHGDLTEPLKGSRFHIVISNPPYISETDVTLLDENVREHEPLSALAGGDDGLHFYRRLANEIPAIIENDGMIFLEIGYDQGEAVSCIMKDAFPRAIVTVHGDINGKDRIVSVQLKPA